VGASILIEPDERPAGRTASGSEFDVRERQKRTASLTPMAQRIDHQGQGT
jgi:hypothetical protein